MHIMTGEQGYFTVDTSWTEEQAVVRTSYFRKGNQEFTEEIMAVREGFESWHYNKKTLDINRPRDHSEY